LRTDYTICKERINKRGRVEEEGLPIELLENLEKNHDEWLLDETMTNKLVFNNDSDEDKYEDFAKQIEQYIDGNLVMT
jgi:deoxyadenosine/deoxycytidine kinase